MSDLEPSQVESRRAARDRALELLYEAEAKGLGLDEVLAGLPVAPAELAVELVRGVEAHRGRIDEILSRRVAPRWSLTRLATVDRAVLRLATYELLAAPDRPDAVVINEAVVLARRYGTDDSPRFVNGVLSAVAGEVRGRGSGRGRSGRSGAKAGTEAEGRAGVPPATDAAAAARAALAATVAATDRRADALVIDLDGVIRHWAPDALDAIDRGFGLPPGTVGAAAFDPVRFEPAMRGELTWQQWNASLGEAVAAAHPVEAAAVAKAFGETAWEIDPAVLDLVEEVRAEVPVALLSNASTRLLDDLRAAGIAERFDAVVGSADIGACKPDAGAFEAAAERLGVPVGRCLVIDDRSENVDGARAAGLQAQVFTGAEALRAVLADAGLLTGG